MKSKLTLLIALIGIFALVSCSEKNLYDPEQVEKGVDELIVPEGFDWKMTNDVACKFTAPAATNVAVYTTADYSENSLVAEYTVSPEDDDEGVLLQLPAAVTQLYVKTGELKKTVGIVNGVASLELPTTRGSVEEDPGVTSNHVKYFPSRSGWATLMFEDNFPIKGDYDFNDFVINYNYAAQLIKKDKKIESITFKVRVKALGGIYEYKPYIRFVGAKGQAKILKGSGVTEIAKNDFAISIDKYTQKPAGAEFLNTKLNEEKVTQYTTIEFTIEFNGGMDQDKLEIDFYLKGKGHAGKEYEIHQKGFKALDSSCYPTGDAGLGRELYTTNDHFVWGITIPIEVPHALEMANFLKAYPKFAEWVESGGNAQKEWYTTQNSGYLFPLN